MVDKNSLEEYNKKQYFSKQSKGSNQVMDAALLRKGGIMPTKILIVEDDQAISQMYRIKFEAEGYTVDTAENGKLGLELAESMKPDIILLDLMMPEMNGDEMLQKLRNTSWGKDIKVVILTNMGEADVAENAIKLGTSGFIMKAQFTPAQVVEKIKQTLNLP